jgi:uncharacterized membrane protein YadS
VVPGLALFHGRRAGKTDGRMEIGKYFPLFVLGFLAMAVARSVGDAGVIRGGHAFGVWEAPAWKQLTKTLGETWATAALGAAMAAVGLTTNLRSLRVLGARPLYLGAISAAVVAGLALGRMRPRSLACSRAIASLPRRAPPPSITSGDFARRERKSGRLEELPEPAIERSARA